MKLYMFRKVPLSVIRSFSLYTHQWYTSYRFADSLRAGSGRKAWPPHSRVFWITHNDTPQSVGFSGRVISSSQRPLPDNTQHSQQTNIHALGGIRTHDLSRRTAADLRLRPRGHWDRQNWCI